jgi:hypothetical protein
MVLAATYSLGVTGWFALQYSDPSGAFLAAQSLIVTLIVWQLLHRRCVTGSRPATIATWTIVTGFAIYSALGALSFAPGAMPAALLLVLATSATPRGGGPTD